MAKVLVGQGYLTTFNSPRDPLTHVLRRSRMRTLGRLWEPLGGMGLWNPLDESDLVHTFNLIPAIPSRPWMVSFESSLPRCFGPKREIARAVLRERLLSPRCRKVIAISRYAVRRMEKELAGWRGLPALRGKLAVIPPNVQVRERSREYRGGRLSLLFIGNHFARKGGIVTLRMAKAALERKLPVDFHIVSALEYGGGIYTDCRERDSYSRDMALLGLPNVVFHGVLANAEVRKLMERSHFVLLPTLHDTYGFSMLEGMAQGTPVIATNTAAIPEVVREGENGFLLPLATDEIGDWIQLRHGQPSWTLLDDTFESLAHASLACVERVLETPGMWDCLSAGACAQIRGQHDSREVGAVLESLYSEALG